MPQDRWAPNYLLRKSRIILYIKLRFNLFVSPINLFSNTR